MRFIKTMKLASLISLSVLFLISCGGGSDSDSSDGNPPPSGAITWSPGVFQDEDTFKNFCQVPRSGTDINGNPWPDRQGSTLHENHWLRSWSNNTYLWYDEIDDQNPANFSSPLLYFDELKTFATTSSGNPKDKFHFTSDTAEYQQQVSSGASAGYGARFQLLSSSPPRDVRVAFTEPSSPATSVGLARGAEILQVDGVDVVNGSNVDALNAGLFPDSAGETHEFVIRDLGSASTRTISMTSAIVTSDPVQNEQVFNTATGRVGYMQFNTFGTRIAEQEIIDAFINFDNQNVQDLVVDLRYNGGGFLFISSQLAYMVAGSSQTSGRYFENLVFNDKHPSVNPVTGETLQPTPFYNAPSSEATAPGGQLPALNLNRVFVLSTARTCSASEAFINGLRGIDVEVVLVGTTTCGKPYGFYATDNCGTTYFTIQFKGENFKSYGDYSDGFVPAASDNGFDVVNGCVVDDDFAHQLGDPNEAMLSAALYYQANGSCPVTTQKPLQQYKNDLNQPGSLLSDPELQRRLFLQQHRILETPQELKDKHL